MPRQYNLSKPRPSKADSQEYIEDVRKEIESGRTASEIGMRHGICATVVRTHVRNKLPDLLERLKSNGLERRHTGYTKEHLVRNKAEEKEPSKLSAFDRLKIAQLKKSGLL